MSCSLERTPLSVIINSSNKIDAILDCLAPYHSILHTLELDLCPPGLKALSMLVANLPKLTVLRLSVEGVNIGDVCQVAFGLPVDQETLLDSISRALACPVDTFLSAQLLSDVYLEGIGKSHVGVPLMQLTRFAGNIFVSKTISRSSKMLLVLVEGLDAVSDRALVFPQRSVMACSTLATLFVHRHPMSEVYSSSNITVFQDRREERQRRT
ncbi:hypothetical protein EV421DRAFT_1911508 [Armillaria borealis]|uniref:Uncharacterized protein n=1 Tax=Armillaria borealis TaxID=47425 RepID=A0AA39IZ17_9AGAR|nr:hypothetical protein EV421DRAFT_1911508 [Armillaria borealis]